jgi:hypothetical protein
MKKAGGIKSMERSAAMRGNQNASKSGGIVAVTPKVTAGKRVAAGAVGLAKLGVGAAMGLKFGPIGVAAGAAMGALSSATDFDYAIRGKSSAVYKNSAKFTRKFNKSRA